MMRHAAKGSATAVLLLLLVSGQAVLASRAHIASNMQQQGEGASAAAGHKRALLQDAPPASLPATPATPVAQMFSNLSPEATLLFLSTLFSNLRSSSPATVQRSGDNPNNGTDASETTASGTSTNTTITSLIFPGGMIPDALDSITEQFQNISAAFSQAQNNTARDALCVWWQASRLAQNTVAAATFSLAQPASNAALQTPVGAYIAQTVAAVPTPGATLLDDQCADLVPAPEDTLQSYLTKQIGDSPVSRAFGGALRPYETFAASARARLLDGGNSTNSTTPATTLRDQISTVINNLLPDSLKSRSPPPSATASPDLDITTRQSQSSPTDMPTTKQTPTDVLGSAFAWFYPWGSTAPTDSNPAATQLATSLFGNIARNLNFNNWQWPVLSQVPGFNSLVGGGAPGARSATTTTTTTTATPPADKV